MHCMAFLRKGEPLGDYIERGASLPFDGGRAGPPAPPEARGPEVGHQRTDPPTPLEVRILRALKDDSRRRASEMAEELGVSARTINNKLLSMRKEGKAVFTIRWSADYSKEAVALVHLRLGATEEEPRSGADTIQSVPRRSWSSYPPSRTGRTFWSARSGGRTCAASGPSPRG